MRIKAATVAAAGLLAALLINHAWVYVLLAIQMARKSPAGRPPANFGVELPGNLKFFVKLDHFAEDYGYVLIPLAWVVAFLVALVWLGLRDFLRRSKAVKASDDWPIDP